MPPIEKDRIERAARIYASNHAAGLALGIAPGSFGRLCRRYGIDNSHRTKHGALLDAELLADVYIEMNGGRQAALGLVNQGDQNPATNEVEVEMVSYGARPAPLPSRLTEAEFVAHEKLIARMGDKALWRKHA